MSKLLATLVLIPFFAFSMVVCWQHGYFGFLTLAWEEPWGMQIFLDLCIALSIVATWLVRDCRRRGATAWPWLAITVALGSIGPLLYLALGRHQRDR